LCCALARLTIASFDRRQARREPSTSTFASAAQLGTRDHILFRDLLRIHAQQRQRVRATEAPTRGYQSQRPAGFLDGKTQFITQTLAEAATWAATGSP
jgi:GrpB-like predicted nucleotidyltransferase (UPF0157 family)